MVRRGARLKMLFFMFTPTRFILTRRESCPGLRIFPGEGGFRTIAAHTVQSQTASNVASNVTSTTTVHLSRNSGNGAFYSDAACSTALVGDNVTIANGTSSTNFFF